MSSARDAELFKSPCAQLYLVGDGAGESLLMQTGSFAVVLVKNPVSQLGAVVAMVDEVQWPVGFDASVTKKEEGSFTFVLPGFIVYDLVLKELASTDLRRLEHILREYSDYGEPAEVQANKNAAGAARAAGDEAAGPSSRSGSEKPSGAISSQMKRRMLRAHRMSAIVKVFSRSLARGAISASTHVEAKDGADSRSPISPDFNLAGVDAVAKVVEAVETGGRALLEGLGSSAMAGAPSAAKPAQAEHDTTCASASGPLLVPMWTLNKPGLLMLYRVISVSLAMHSSSSSSSGGSGSGRSGSSCSSEIRRLFSSPSFSSSSSSGKSLSLSPSCSGAGDHAATALSLQPPAGPPAGAAAPSTTTAPPPPPPPPPLFSEHPSRARHSGMPPPPILPPPMPGPPQAGTSSVDSPSSAAFRVYKPRPTAATPPAAPPMPPSFIPRPPRFQAPPKS